MGRGKGGRGGWGGQTNESERGQGGGRGRRRGGVSRFSLARVGQGWGSAFKVIPLKKKEYFKFSKTWSSS